MSILLALMLPRFAQADEPVCPDPATTLSSAENDIVSFFLSDAENSLVATVDAFGCARPATPDDVSRLLLAKGMILQLQGDPEAAGHAFASARAVSPETFNEDYGPKIKAVWEQASLQDGKPATVAIRNLAAGETLWLDGAVDRSPLKISPGMHLLQAGQEVPRFARLLEVADGEELTVALPALQLATTEDSALSTGIERHRNFVPAVLIGVSAALLYGGAIGARQAYDASPTDPGVALVNGLYGGSIATGVAAGSLFIVQLTKKG